MMQNPHHGYHGFYSAKAARQFGTATYLLDDGKEAEVTAIYKTKDGYPADGWSDLNYVGRVVKFIKTSKLRRRKFEVNTFERYLTL